MDASAKTEWISDLRDAGLSQVKGQLHDVTSDAFCCLGVLCRIAVKHGIAQEDEFGSFGEIGASETVGDWNSELLPDSVIEWAGLISDDPLVTVIDENGDEFHSSLSDLNDNRDYTFSMIADVIEKHL